MLSKKGDADAMLTAQGQHGRRAGDPTPANKTLQCMHGYAELEFALDLYRDCFAVAMEIRTLCHHVHRVQKLSHGTSTLPAKEGLLTTYHRSADVRIVCRIGKADID
jgi:hypothetical protein